MKRIIITILLCIIFFIFDNALVPFFSIKGYYPSLLLIFATFYSIINGASEAAWIGVFTGILQDLYFYNGFFINTFSNMILCVVAAQLGKNILREKILMPVLISFVINLSKGLIVFVILYLVKIHVNFQSIVFNSIYAITVSFVMYRWTYKFLQKDYMQKQWKF